MKVTAEYLMGIAEGRQYLRAYPDTSPREAFDGCVRTIRSGFDAQSPVGQILRGERDFWRNQLRMANA